MYTYLHEATASYPVPNNLRMSLQISSILATSLTPWVVRERCSLKIDKRIIRNLTYRMSFNISLLGLLEGSR